MFDKDLLNVKKLECLKNFEKVAEIKCILFSITINNNFINFNDFSFEILD